MKETRIKQCIEGKHDNYILPFLWLHGESHERLYEEILAIKNSGVSAFCAESRPFDDFCADAWWDTFAFLLETAKKLDMKVWLLDDKTFPTGFANGGLMKEENAHLRKVLVREKQCDLVGPVKNATVLIDGWVNEAKGESLMAVVAYKMVGQNEELELDSAIDLTDTYADGCVYFDLPEGIWRICTVIRTHEVLHPNPKHQYYIDMLNKESCRVLIDEVYEPHYARFGEYFGNTFQGFFSDEPGFLNSRGYDNTLGILFEPYPWCDELMDAMKENVEIGDKHPRVLIPALWEDFGSRNALIRGNYMEKASDLYRENFSYQLGDWCRDHGVMYIGHVIEDNGAHTRLGYGAGHYFKALDGQDMAGMDVVLMQVFPGLGQVTHRAPLSGKGDVKPNFYHYTLEKLTASHAHLQAEKKGRAMCELFGAFGWAEGLPFMKQITDLMLVCGMNHFVPHAFSPKEKDPDCPPHFYNGGKNPQYEQFGKLMSYTGKCAHILSDGIHKADVAVYYNAESEWGGGKKGTLDDVCATLTRALIDYDIVPYGMLAGDKAVVKDAKLWINGESFGALIVPESDILPQRVLALFARLRAQGLPVIFANALPVRTWESADTARLPEGFSCVELAGIPAALRERKLCAVEGDCPDLRYYHVTRDGADIYMFTNDDPRGTIDTVITLPNTGDCLLYNAWDDSCRKGVSADGRLRLHLAKGDSLFVVFGAGIPADAQEIRYEAERRVLPARYTIYLKDAEGGEPELYRIDSEPIDITAPAHRPHFSGEIRYETEIELEDGFDVLDLGEVGEIAAVRLNGVYIGSKINAPYTFDIAKAKVTGKNKLEVTVINNNAHRGRDQFSHYMCVPPSGLLGDIYQCRYLPAEAE